MKGKKCTKEELTKDYLNVKERVGHYPSLREYTKHGKFSQTAFHNHFISWGNFTLQAGGEIQKGGGKKLIAPPFEIPLHNDYFKIYTPKAILCGDLHIPMHNIATIEAMVNFAIKYNIKRLIMVGDVLDFKRLYTKDVQTDGESWVTEIKEGGNVLKFLLTIFDQIDWSAGNHDYWRLSRLLKSDKDAIQLMKVIYSDTRIKISSHFYCEINDWILGNHPSKARANKVSLGEDLCERYLKSVINLHTHRYNFSVHKSGKFVSGDGLHLTIPDAHEYKLRNLGTYDEWVAGWWVIINDKVLPYPIHDRIYNPFLDGSL